MGTVLIVPGLHGSGENHWQSWFERQLSDTVRVHQSDWSEPHLPRWAGAVRREIDHAVGEIWIVAHSFGCLAAAHAATDYQERIAGALFVAPADPDKFSVSTMLPNYRFSFPSVMVATTNDPWMRLIKAAYWAEQWGSHLINIGAAGHINPDSGFGPWPDGLEIFEQLRQSYANLPLGNLVSS